jgi:hypothetical protein
VDACSERVALDEQRVVTPDRIVENIGLSAHGASGIMGPAPGAGGRTRYVP